MTEREAIQLQQRVAHLERMIQQLLQPKSVARLMPEVGGRLFMPSSGIPAMTGTSSPWTPGVQSCTRLEYYLDGSTVKIRTTSLSEDVYNPSQTAVTAGNMIQAKKIEGKWTVDTEDCDP
jgi:hypothetical protein